MIFRGFFKKKSQSRRQNWFDDEKNQLFNKMSQNVLKLALNIRKGNCHEIKALSAVNPAGGIRLGCGS